MPRCTSSAAQPSAIATARNNRHVATVVRNLIAPARITRHIPNVSSSDLEFALFVILSLSSGAISRPAHHGRREMLDRRRADLLHDGAQLDTQELEHALD